MNKAQGLWRHMVTPRATNDDEARLEYMTRVILALTGVSLALFTVPVLAGYLAGIFDSDALVSVVLIGLFIAASWWLTVRGQWRLASYIPPLIFYLLGVMGSCRDGLWATQVLGYAVAILLAAMLLGSRAQWLMVGLSVFTHLVFGQWLHPQRLDDFLSSVVVVTASLVGLALLQSFALSLLQTALAQTRAQNARLQTEIGERRRAERDLRALNETLEDRVAERMTTLSQLNVELMREVTERERAEAVLQATLNEKDVLLKEVHHRVKNNLQVISSLLQLEAKQLMRNPEAEAAFRESQQRVRSMSLIHEKLYQSPNLAEIDLADYIRQLATSMVRSYQGRAEFDLRLELDKVELGVDQAVPCGLILNELITNALKYASRSERRGTLWIELRAGPGAEVHLTVADDGPGLPNGLDIYHTPSLGLQLVTGLAAQLQGTVQVDGERGASFHIAFPYPA